MSHSETRYAVFNNYAEFEAWNLAAGNKAQVGSYSFQMPRITPDDGTIAAPYYTGSDVWGGPSLTRAEVVAAGYVPPTPPPEPPEEP